MFSGQRGFRRSKLRLKNLLKQKRKKGKRPIKVGLCTHTATLINQCDDLCINQPVFLCMCLFAARSVKGNGIGRLLVTILEATELKASKPNGERGYTNVTGCPYSSVVYETHHEPALNPCCMLHALQHRYLMRPR